MYICTGGIGGFVLSVFHKMETSGIAQNLQSLPLLARSQVVCMYILYQRTEVVHI